MGMWVEYQECYLISDSFAENSPPNAAICTLIVLLLISVLLFRFRRSFGLVTAELVVVYTALLVAAPLMTQGMWHRFFGLLAAFPHHQDFKSYQSMPPVLWPHGANLIENPRFDNSKDPLYGFTYQTATNQKPAIKDVSDWDGKLIFPEEEKKRLQGMEEKQQKTMGKLYQKKPIPEIPTGLKTWHCPVLTATNDPKSKTTISIVLHRHDTHGHEVLVPGEQYLLSMLLRADELQATSSYFITAHPDNQRPLSIFSGASSTSPSFSCPGAFERIGVCPVTLPSDLQETFTLDIGISGPGKVLLQDLQFFNVEVTEGAYSGRKMVRQSNWKQLSNGERDFTVIKPDNMFSLAGLNYLVHGFIPLRPWLMPALAWSLLIGALFLGFFGFNVLMRKQWAENERFTFPMNIFPRQLFSEEADENGVRGIFHNKTMWLGFWIVLVLVLMKGLHFYYPAVPSPDWGDMWGNPRLDTFVTDPLLKAFLGNCFVNLLFALLAIMLLVETDILFSVWFTFLLFQLMPMFGKMFNWNGIPGYPWEFQQSVGAFIAFAILAIWYARRHLAKVFLHILGKESSLDDSQEIISYRAAILFILLSVVLLVLWGAWTKMGWGASLLFFGWILICGFTASKIRAEAGMPFAYWTPYFGMMFVSALGGFASFGTTGMLVATIASGFMCVSCFLFIAPVQVEMMELGRFFKVRPRDIGYGLFLGLLGGLFIGGFALLCWGYGRGVQNSTYTWPFEQNWYFSGYRSGELGIDKAMANGQLVTPQTQTLNFVTNVDAKGVGIGIVVTIILAFLRSTFMWFPIHPLGYVLATTYFGRTMWFTAFVAWLIRVIVLRLGGAHSIRRGLIPFCVGMFLACMVSIIFFDIVAIYRYSHGIANAYCKWP